MANTQDQRLATADATTPADRIASPLHPLVLTMCDEITIGDKTVDTIRELRAAMPTARIIKSPHYMALPPDDSCLCGVDICATLVQAGCDYDHDPGSGRWSVWPDGVSGL